MRNELPTAIPRNGVLLLGGYGIRVAVERGHLCVEDGVGSNRRSASFPRLPSASAVRVRLGTARFFRDQHGYARPLCLRSFFQLNAASEYVNSFCGHCCVFDGHFCRLEPNILAPKYC